MDDRNVKLPLGVKLAAIMGVIVLVSLHFVTMLNSHFIGQDVRITAEENNLSVNIKSAYIVENKISDIRSNVFQLLDLISVVNGGKNSVVAKQAIAFFFERNPDVASIDVLSENSLVEDNPYDSSILNSYFFIANEIDEEMVRKIFITNCNVLKRSCSGETIAINVSHLFNMPVMTIFFHYTENGKNQTCAVTFSIESILDMIGINSTNTTYIINDSDDLLCHPDPERLVLCENMSSNPLVWEMRQGNHNNEDGIQISYADKDSSGKKRKYFGAYQKISYGDIAVVTTIPVDTVLEGVEQTKKNNLHLAGAVFFVSVAFILCYTRFAISRHLGRLSRAADEIQKGNFDANGIFEKLDVKRTDEIGVLNRSTKAELGFLNTFSRFTNIDVAKKIARNEIDFEPHLKDVTIFFSDIRGFTAISDGFKNRFGNESPRHIINFLNDYMGRMVECITLSGGNVDKFEGDAIMAVWGIMRDDNIEYERLALDSDERKKAEMLHLEHVRADALNACRGTLAMRYSLMKYNKDAAVFTREHSDDKNASYKPEIKMGCGLNTGRVTAGILGSKDKMEYTAIGDAVNFASRTESSNKPCGTDMLMSQDTYDLLKMDYIRCPENNFTLAPENEADELIVEMIPVEFSVKGKGNQHFYGLVNMPRFDIKNFFGQSDPDFIVDEECSKAVGVNGPKTLREVRELLGIEMPDFEKVELNEEENKVQISR